MTSNVVVSLEKRQVLEGHSAAVRVVKFNQDGSYCMSGGYDKSIILWNPHQAKKIHTYRGHGYQVLDLDISLDHTKFISCGGDKQPFLWDVASGKVIRKFRGHDSKINCIIFNGNHQDTSLSSSIMVTGSDDQKVKVWDCKSRSIDPIQVMSDARDSVTCVSISKYDIFSVSVDGCLRCYDVRMGQLRTDSLTHSLSSITLSRDGQIILLSTLANKLLLIDKEDGTLYHDYEAHKNTEFRVDSSFLNNDSLVVSGSETGSLFIWGLEDSTLLLECKAHDQLLMGLSPHPFGGYLLTASGDRTVKLWAVKVSK